MAQSHAPKAYQAHDGDEGWAIVFATNSAAARRYAANEMDTDWEGVEFCRRAPALDHYAPGPVPVEAMIRFGWWFECIGCCCRVDSDTPQPVYVGDVVYHSPWCRLAAMEERLIREAEARIAIERAEAFVLAKFPGVTITQRHAHAQYRGRHGLERAVADISFSFPGGRYGDVCYYEERPQIVGVPGGDVDAWHAYVASLTVPPAQPAAQLDRT